MSQRHSVRSASDLFTLLRHPEMNVRLALLQSIVQHPDRAMAYGKHEDRDLVDELTSLLGESRWGEYRLLVLHALLAIDDPRVVVVCQEEFARSNDAPTLLAIAKRLEREPKERRRDLAPLLFDASRDKVRVAADLLNGCSDLSPSERLQVALYAARPVTEPPALEESPELWFAALEGPRLERARELLQKRGEVTFGYLKARWQRLSQDNLGWLFEWAAQDFSEATPELFREVLATSDEGAVLVALQHISQLGAAGEGLRSAVAPYAEHPNSQLRLAVLKSGLLTLDLYRLAREETAEIRLAAIHRLPKVYSEEAIPSLLSLLKDDNWQIRSAATNALVRLGKPAAEAVKPLVRSESEGARIAAIQVLTQLDETLWLEELLIST